MHDDLINGYMKEEYRNHIEYKDSYPLELNKCIAQFLGSLLFKFDICNQKGIIDQFGKCITYFSQQFYGVSSIDIASSYCMDHGITIVDIKCIQPGYSDSIGITSNIQSLKAEYSDKNRYFWQGNNICSNNNKSWMNQIVKSDAKKWRAND